MVPLQPPPPTLQRHLTGSLASGGHGQMLHQKRLNPVVLLLLADAISDGRRLNRHLEALAEGLGETIQRPGLIQSPSQASLPVLRA